MMARPAPTFARLAFARLAFARLAFARLAFATLAAALPIAGPAGAEEVLTMGIGSAPNSADPHYQNGTSGQTLAYNLYDTLFDRQPDSSLAPGLAVEWKPLGPTQWEVRLREGVRFSDGRPFTADDVAFTIRRVPTVPNSPASYGGLVRAITRVEVVDPLRLVLHTNGPAPTLPLDLAFIAIVSRHAGEGATSEDYNSGKAAVGTGPYRMAGYAAGSGAELVRNEHWWGARPDWDRVVFKYLPNPGSRTAALLSGGVDLIDTPSPNDLPRLQGDPRFAVWSSPGLRLVFLAPNQAAQSSPFITGADGRPLPGNPLRDRRVRQALSAALNRTNLADRLMQGTAQPSGQFMPPGTYSYDPALPVPRFDPDGARRLLAEAGYPDGFRVVLPVASDSRPTDPVVAQAIAQMWTRIGVQTQVEVMPFAAYAPRSARLEFAFTMSGWATPGQAGHALLAVVNTDDRARLTGSFNRSGYSNPAVDALTARALATLDDAGRETLLREAVAMAMEDVAIIPLYHLTNYWVTRRGVTYDASNYDFTRARQAHLAR